MSKLITRIKRLALALCFVTPLVSWADAIPVVNPVTDETETYENVFTSETTEWNSAENWTLKESDKVPFVSGGNYDPALVDGKAVSTSTAIDGWTLRVGAYNGAAVTWNGGITKIQAGSAGCWLTADETSSITIASFGGAQLEGSDAAPFKLSSANAGGITWYTGLTSAGNTTLPFWYYLKGEGTVVYGGDITVANAQVIKQADVAISGTSRVASKMLVGFDTGTTKTFTADAAIKIKNGDNVLKTVYLTSVSANDDTTLTTEDAVGTCELVQKYDGVYLYWVDGDPAALPAPTVYKPSISINFTDSGNGLTTGADVGLTDYEVPGTSWNNFAGSNGTYGEVKAVADSSGSASVMSGVSVTVSGTRGSWATSLPSSSNPLHGYIDENAGNSTPTVTVTGIPYYKYRVLVYHSTDTEDVPFGYDTINGTNYTYEEDALSEGTTAWGNSGPDGSADAIAAGGNVLVTEAISGSTLTVVGHRAGGDSSARGCIAAIQIIEVKADVGENDLEIAVVGETEHTVTAEEAEKTGTVYLTGSGTLTLAGEAKISAATIEVGDLVTLVVNADRLDGTTFTGAGTVVYDGTKPASGKGWTDSTWTGTVWVKNIPTSSNERKDWDLALYGNADSTLRFTGVNLYFPNNTTTTFPGTVDIDGEGMNVCDGYGGSIATFARLTGSGTLSTAGGSSNGNGLTINDASGFTGTITLTKYKVIVGTSTGTSASGVLQIESGKSITVAGATAPGGFVVNGTLVANGTLASSAAAAVTGSGTVTFGGVPSPVDGENETKWWKNAGWTGTVEIKGASIAGDTYAFNDYGNATSTVKLTNCSGWLTGGYTCVPALEIGGTFTWNDGWSNLNNTFKVGTLKGSGTISIPNQGAATAVWQITDNWSGFTGAVVGNNNAGKRVLVFGSTLPSSVTAGEIYISEGATLNLDNASGAWWGVGMGFVVDGTVKATNRSKWGGGTTMTLGDTGILEITRSDSAYSDDGGTDYGNVTGTGTIKFSGSGFTVLSQSIPTSLTFAAEKDSGSVVPVAGATIGSLTGSKGFRSDWGNGNRYLTIKQSKNTAWDGSINVDGAHRLTGVIVDPGDSTTGTLTLTAAQTASSTLTVNGSVNLTGTWVGATTVAGTIGGTGTLTGDLTFSTGSTFKAYATDDADGLVVSGAVTCPEEGTVTVDVSAITPEADVALLKAANLDATKFVLSGAPEGATLKVVEDVLTLSIPTPVVARYAGVDYATIAEAIAAALADEGGAANIANIEVVDTTAEVPAGYYIDGTSIVQYPVVLVKDGEAHSYYNAVGAAIQAVFMTLAGQYDYVEIVAGTSFDLPLGMLASIKVKNTVNAEPVLDGVADDCTWSSEAGETYTTYNKVNKPTVYTWTGAASAHRWGNRSNWSFVDSNEDTVTASRTPEAGDTVVFNTDVDDVVIGADPAVVAINVGAAVTISKEYEAEVAITVTDAIVLTDVDATLTVSGVTLNPTPTTTVESGVVVTEGTDPVTYSVALTVTFSLPEVEGATVASVEGATANGDGTYTAIIGDTVTVTWVANEGKVVTGGVKEFEATADTAAANIPTPDSVVDAIALDPAEMELYPNCSNYVWVVNAPEGSTYTFKFDNTHVGSGGYSSTLGWAKPYAKRPGSGTVTAYVTNNNEQVAMLVCNVTVKDVVAVVNGEEYTTAQWETAVADAIDNDQVLEVYYNVANITLPVGQTLKWKAADNRGQGKVTVLAPGATESAMYKVTSTKDTETGITTVVCTNEGAPNVEHTSADGQTVTYYATLSMSKTGTYRILRDMEVAGVSVNSKGAVTLDLNGKTLTATGSNAGVLVYPAITGTSTTLTITGGGTVNVTGTNPVGVPAVWAARTGRVIIESGTFIGYRISVYASDTATATINGGTFRSIDSSDGLLNCEDTNKGAITVTGGTFEGFNPANNGADGAGTNYVPDGYRSTETSTGVWTVALIPQGIDPTDPDSKQDVTVEPTGDDEADKAAAEAQGTVQIKFTDATVTAALQTAATAAGKTVQELYNSYFTYSATKSTTVENGWDVVATGIAATVTEPVETKAVADVQDVTKTTVEVSVPAGLYYKIETFAELGGTAADTESGISSGTAVSVDKPTSETPLTQSFVRVRISATEIVDPVADPGNDPVEP